MVSDNELKELKMVFRLTDKNGDGSITADELKRMLQDKLDIDVDDALIGDLMTSAGENAGGLISEAQFITWFLKMQTLSADKTPDMTNDLFAAFRLFDKDGNGYITMDELRRAMELIEERMTESELSSLIEMADADKDGRINYEGNSKPFRRKAANSRNTNARLAKKAARLRDPTVIWEKRIEIHEMRISVRLCLQCSGNQPNLERNITLSNP
ncbi:calcium-binding protein E63-1-like [Pollicipes pollicipes]|uniref:calcium-binding protein E63-1-like n=1 Tax=Pollicipes pollicipes TaxID=41117 RepID=UPI0018849F23|nr:calcium-binding protein E63-1-like [Pollicipes pollicipes]